MKKIYLMLLFTIVSYSQESFVRKYNQFVQTRNHISQPAEQGSLTVVFNPEGKKEVVFYYSDGTNKTLYQTSPVRTGKTEDEEEYQIIEVVDGDNGRVYSLQLFNEINALRLIFGPGYTINFFK